MSGPISLLQKGLGLEVDAQPGARAVAQALQDPGRELDPSAFAARDHDVLCCPWPWPPAPDCRPAALDIVMPRTGFPAPLPAWRTDSHGRMDPPNHGLTTNG
jgi:hypothetical protein